MPIQDVPAKLGKTYRDKIKGVAGQAVAIGDDGMVQLKLRPEHVEGTPEHQARLAGEGSPEVAHDLRWYEPDRLEPADAR